MKTNQIAIAFLSLTCIILFANCGGEDFSGEIKAAVHDACGGTINFDGTHVFAYKTLYGGTDYLLVGGYPDDEGRELGIYMRWPPADGTYDISPSLSISVYYDPNNTCDDCPADGVDQYGASNGGQIVLSNVVLDANSANVLSISVAFSDIIATHRDAVTYVLDTLCLDSGVIHFED